MLEIKQILARLPHRYPFVYVDKVVEIKENSSIMTIKNITINEHFFQGHFPNYPVVPGVIIIEALAQTCGILISISENLTREDIYFLAAIESAKFKKPVVPGDVLIMSAEVVKKRAGLWKFKVRATVNEQDACVAVLTNIKAPYDT